MNKETLEKYVRCSYNCSNVMFLVAMIMTIIKCHVVLLALANIFVYYSIYQYIYTSNEYIVKTIIPRLERINRNYKPDEIELVKIIPDMDTVTVIHNNLIGKSFIISILSIIIFFIYTFIKVINGFNIIIAVIIYIVVARCCAVTLNMMNTELQSMNKLNQLLIDISNCIIIKRKGCI